VPEKKNEYEALYYATVGQIYTPYIVTEPVTFDTSSVADTLTAASLQCPRVDRQNFNVLMQYAKERSFGLSPGVRSQGHHKARSI
jgi:hypothetical protein